ncbi:A/G-specific adenine glycosylase [Legionella dresdenensis]|uniref:Adenine DNA glycosylase n=1 Tax=Legionella dresdenensis TaxID=450200 RepID=A0ABV8CC68_9GAMM
MTNTPLSFSNRLLDWFDLHGRKNLPWQHPRSAYRVWISEIMLQQTQVQTVIPYFERFMARFPTLQVLADSDEDQVLAYWSGLGYYSRARNIHKTAQLICQQWQGIFPETITGLTNLPGIGETTAAAILSQAFNKPAAILDGNVKRVLSRHFMVDGFPEQSAVKKRLWQLARESMPEQRCADYTQAIMDLGATCCTKKPDCASCPLNQTCLAYREQKAHLYPYKKARKALPEKHEQFLLLYNDQQQIYLEKRPPSGIWGGLWCLPAIDQRQNATEFVQTQYGLSATNTIALTEIKHTFSHFHLYIKAMALKITSNATDRVCESKGKWLEITELENLGLAKPVNDVITCFYQNISK